MIKGLMQESGIPPPYRAHRTKEHVMFAKIDLWDSHGLNGNALYEINPV